MPKRPTLGAETAIRSLGGRNIGEKIVRKFLALALFPLAACNVNNDGANDQVTLEYNEQRLEEAADDATNVAREVGSSLGNVAESTGDAIANEVGDIDVDVDVNRDPSGNQQ